MNTTYQQGVPVLDYGDFAGGDSSRQNQFVAALLDAYHEIGFVGVQNHGVAAETIDSLYSAAWDFSALPDATKGAYHRPDLFGQRGYTPKGKEHAKGAKVGDLKEFFHVGQELDEARLGELGYPANVWPSEVPQLQTSAVNLFRALEGLGHGMLDAIFVGLGIDPGHFSSDVREGNSILRIAHYFPIEDPSALPSEAVRAAAHGDINLITLLVGASADGLELQRRDGAWMPVNVESDTIVVNVGDMLERLTNGRLRSTIHRVVNPPPERCHEARLSMPFFMHPKASMDLSALECCMDEEHPKQFEDITAGAFLQERLREIGLK